MKSKCPKNPVYPTKIILKKKKTLLLLTDVQVDRSKSLFPEKHLIGKKIEKWLSNNVLLKNAGMSS